jgi:hypothetical protein
MLVDAVVIRRSRIDRRSLFAGLALLLVSGPARAGAWEKIDEEEGIKVFRKEVAGSPLVAFRGEAMISAPLEKLLWVLADNAHRTDWVDRLKKSVVLATTGSYEYVVYQHFSLPFPISDRDYVYRGRATRDQHGVVTLAIASVTHPKAPATIGVRANLIGSRYVLTPKGPDKTYVVVEVHTDPKGAIPTWLVNLIQKSWPMKTLKGLRAQVTKSFVKRLELPPDEAPKS